MRGNFKLVDQILNISLLKFYFSFYGIYTFSECGCVAFDPTSKLHILF